MDGWKAAFEESRGRVRSQGYLSDKKTHPPKTLPQAYACGPRVILEGGGAFSYERDTLVAPDLGGKSRFSELGLEKSLDPQG